jgi:hypothetical protein
MGTERNGTINLTARPLRRGAGETENKSMKDLNLIRFRWWYSGLTTEGNTARFEGTGYAKSDHEACDNIEKMMRSKYPTIRWKHGCEVEGEGDNRGVKFGPTIQMLRTKAQRAKLKTNL